MQNVEGLKSTYLCAHPFYFYIVAYVRPLASYRTVQYRYRPPPSFFPPQPWYETYCQSQPTYATFIATVQYPLLATTVQLVRR